MIPWAVIPINQKDYFLWSFENPDVRRKRFDPEGRAMPGTCPLGQGMGVGKTRHLAQPNRLPPANARARADWIEKDRKRRS
jgi:hypothetical protein